MEAFSRMIEKAVSGGFLTACQVGGRGGVGEKVSRLLFADDTLIFCEASQDKLTYLCLLLMLFEACSGLKINLVKSKLLEGSLMQRCWLMSWVARWVISPQPI